MMSEQKNKEIFYPELHDIGKIVDWEKTGEDIGDNDFWRCDHYFIYNKFKKGEDNKKNQLSGRVYDFSRLDRSDLKQINTRSWSGIIWHHKFKKVQNWRSEYGSILKDRDDVQNLFLLTFADSFAASTSRALSNKIKNEFRAKFKQTSEKSRFTLWGGKEVKPRLLKSKKQLIKLMESIRGNNIGSFKEYFDLYADCPEDQMPLLNLTSLKTHNRLTCQIYYLLEKFGFTLNDEEGKETVEISDLTGKPNSVRNAQTQWRFKFIRAQLNFSQRLARIGDFNIFKLRTALIRNLKEDEQKKNHLFFDTTDTLWFVFLEGDKEGFKKIMREFVSSGIWIDYEEAITTIRDLPSPNPREIGGADYKSLTMYSKEIMDAAAIEPPICDICQMRHAKDREDKEGIVEYLCDNCADLREQGEPCKNLASWDGGKAAWIKITLDYDKLIEVLDKLYKDYLNQILRNNQDLIEEAHEKYRKIALMADFTEDYRKFLKIFRSRLTEIFNNLDFEIVDEDFMIVRIRSGEQVKAVIEVFAELMNNYFNRCYNDNCPVTFGLSLAHVKYPYQEHWRFLSAPENTINIQSPMSAKLSINITQYELLKKKIIREDTRLSHFLHCLVDIETETKSNMTVMLEIFNNRKKFPDLLELTQRDLSVHQILDFYKLTRHMVTP